MTRYQTVYKEVEIDVDLADFDDEEILDEIEIRGLGLVDRSITTELLVTIYHKRRNGLDYQYELDQLIYEGLGRII